LIEFTVKTESDPNGLRVQLGDFAISTDFAGDEYSERRIIMEHALAYDFLINSLSAALGRPGDYAELVLQAHKSEAAVLIQELNK